MKINRIEFENFRNFKGHNIIDFPTDGRVTIIYGTNGDGKTTLHQLFQWILYGEVHFNKTASKKMYNHELEYELSLGERFSVRGKIDFEHPNSAGEIENYSIIREWIYRKELKESRIINQGCYILKEVRDDKDPDNYNWKPLEENPNVIIERMLPKGLSQYFFFDGESMIADLTLKGKDSAKSLKKALYSIFDLDIYEQALVHIGTTSSGKSTVLGNLYLNKSDSGNDAEFIKAKGDVNQAITKKNAIQKEIDDIEETIRKFKADIKNLSELIGSATKKEELEKKRASVKKTITTLESAIEKETVRFGNDVYQKYPNLLLSNVVKEAQNRIGLKVGEEHLIQGVTKPLIDALLEEEFCVCGHHIGETERKNLKEYLKKLPPLSYKSMYDNFKRSAARWSSEYDDTMLAEHLAQIFQYRESIEEQHQTISDIDEELKNSSSKQGLIEKRAEAEKSLKFWEGKKSSLEKDLGLWNKYYTQRIEKYRKISSAFADNKIIIDQIEVMEEVRQYFENKIKDVTEDYSIKLANAIQDLLNEMLTSTRKVFMTSKFELSVQDSYNDEAKSEGQFAVVSFAYIGGIFRLLSEEPVLKDKEFPLILDGPFSKLDVIQRQNVINTIPTYAPQMILFSKDDINNCFDEDLSDTTWTLFSNKEKNVSMVKKGYYPEVFTNGYNN